MRYIIALVPKSPDIFIAEAQKYASEAIGYILSNSSLPHITLAQFESADKNKVENIWQSLQSQTTTIPQPEFIGISITRKAANLWGLSLMARRDEDLVNLHLSVIKLLEKNVISCLSPVGELYRSHLTLARIPEPNIVNFNERLLNNVPFVLGFGQGDVNGQYLKTIYQK